MYGLSFSLLLSVSASRIRTQSPDVPDEICNFPAGLSVPIPTLPDESMSNLVLLFVSSFITKFPVLTCIL